MRTFLGIEIGGSKLQLVLGNEQAEILSRFRFMVDPKHGADGIKRQIRDALNKIPLHSVGAIGIGFGGPVDHHTGKILTSYQVTGWSDFVLQDWLEKETAIPVWMDNDANVAAYGEALHGAGKSFKKVFYITLGSGVGAGLVLDQQVYHGAGCAEAEFGHILLDRKGTTVESSCSGWAVDEKIRSHAKLYPDSLLARFTKGYSRGEATVLSRALMEEDKPALEIFEQTVDDFSFALSHVVHLLNPDVVIIGGGLSLIGEPIRKWTEQKLEGYLMEELRPGPAIRLSALKEDAVPVGALCLAINKLTVA